MRFDYCFIALLLILSTVVDGAEYRKVSESGTGAGMIGIGNIMVLGDSPSNLLTSPVGGDGNGMSLFYSTMMDDQSLGSVAVSVRLNPDVSIGVGGIVESISGISSSVTDNEGQFQKEGSTTYQSSELTAGVLIRVGPQLFFGAGYTYFQKNYFDVSGTGYGLSVGLKWQHGSTAMSFTARNINNAAVTYRDGSLEGLSPEYTVNASQVIDEWVGPATLYVQGQYLSAFNVLVPGAGIRVYTPSKIMTFNAGYLALRGNNGSLKAGLVGGISVNLQGVVIDYAYLPVDYIEAPAQHKISVDLKF